MSEDQTKTCSRCRATKPTGEFYSNRAKAGGLDSFCKECRRAASRESMARYAQTEHGRTALRERAAKREYTPEQKARQKAAIKAWDEANPEKRKEYTARYRENNAHKVKERETAYRKANKTKIQASQRKYHQRPEIREANRLRMLEYRKTPEYRIYNRARQEQRYEDYKRLTAEQWLALIDAFESCCAYCGQYYRAAALHMDHVHPRSKGGLLEAGNVVPACKGCNSMKQDKPIEEFAVYPGAPRFDVADVLWVARVLCEEVA